MLQRRQWIGEGLQDCDAQFHRRRGRVAGCLPPLRSESLQPSSAPVGLSSVLCRGGIAIFRAQCSSRPVRFSPLIVSHTAGAAVQRHGATRAFGSFSGLTQSQFLQDPLFGDKNRARALMRARISAQLSSKSQYRGMGGGAALPQCSLHSCSRGEWRRARGSCWQQPTTGHTASSPSAAARRAAPSTPRAACQTPAGRAAAAHV